MAAIRELLPIGSVVLLKNGIKKAMIIGIMQSTVDNEGQVTEYDYLGVLYPEGFFDVKSMFFFNHDQINDVVFRGYANPERADFLDRLEENLEKVTKLLRETLEEQTGKAEG